MLTPESIYRPGPPRTEKVSASRSLWMGLWVLLVRLRFFLVLLAVLLLVGYWQVLGNYWDRLTGSKSVSDGAISLDTEYWCPMCPGVVSDWPAICPVCNMDLIRRKKGEAVVLPEGLVARMQFSPYRVQLAGIRTSLISRQPLTREIVLGGRLKDLSPSETMADAVSPAVPPALHVP